MAAGDQQGDLPTSMGGADRDMAEVAQLAQSDRALEVCAVGADAEVGGRASVGGMSLETGGEGNQRRAALQRTVRAMVVVAATEGVQLQKISGSESTGGWFGGGDPRAPAMEALVVNGPDNVTTLRLPRRLDRPFTLWLDSQ